MTKKLLDVEKLREYLRLRNCALTELTAYDYTQGAHFSLSLYTLQHQREFESQNDGKELANPEFWKNFIYEVEVDEK